MESELKRTWKYFIEQKTYEIVEHFEYAWGGYLFITLFIGFGSQFFWVSKKVHFIAIIGLVIFAFWVFVGFIILLKIIWEWLHDNWKYARERAKKDIAKERKK